MALRQVLIMLVLVAVAACGVDGAPTAPGDSEPDQTGGVTLSGEARIGVTYGG